MQSTSSCVASTRQILSIPPPPLRPPSLYIAGRFRQAQGTIAKCPSTGPIFGFRKRGPQSKGMHLRPTSTRGSPPYDTRSGLAFWAGTWCGSKVHTPLGYGRTSRSSIKSSGTSSTRASASRPITATWAPPTRSSAQTTRATPSPTRGCSLVRSPRHVTINGRFKTWPGAFS